MTPIHSAIFINTYSNFVKHEKPFWVSCGHKECWFSLSLFAAEPAFASSAPFRVLTLSPKAEKASYSGENQPEEVRGKHTLSACRLRAGAESEGAHSGKTKPISCL